MKELKYTQEDLERAIAEERERIAIIIEGMKTNWSGGTPSQGYNQALTEILSLLTKEK